MTPDEADQVLFTMASVWPGKIDDTTIAMWRNRLNRYHADEVYQAIDRLADTAKWWPSWSELVEAVGAVKRANAASFKPLPPAGELASKDDARAALRQAREALRDAGADLSPRSRQRLAGVPWTRTGR